MNRHGFVLIIVLALLGILGFIAIEFAQGSVTARHLSTSALHKVKSRIGARSGLEKSVSGLRLHGWPSGTTPPFASRLESMGDDRDRNGSFDAFTEDPWLDGRFDRHVPLERNLTPSMALVEDETASPLRSLTIPVDGIPRGVSWIDSRVSPSMAVSLNIQRSVIDLNAGVESGYGAEGRRLASELGTVYTYSANSTTHPFNIPFLRLMNAWGNALKHRHMVRFNRTYIWADPIDHNNNLPDNSTLGDPKYWDNPHGLFDMFNPSDIVGMEPGLGTRLLAARPARGFGNVDEAATVLKTYIESWKDQSGALAITGAWKYRDGTPIPAVTPEKVAAMLDEFRSLAALDIARQEVPLLIQGPTDATTLDSSNVFFDDGVNRQKVLNCRPYILRTHLINVNQAPESLIAAVFYGTTYPSAFIYDISQSGSPLTYATNMTYLNHYLENSYRKGTANKILNTTNQPILSMTESLRLASELASGRPWSDMASLGQAIRTWPRGYDGKSIFIGPGLQLIDGRTADVAANLVGYFDLNLDNRREKILANLINPNLNFDALVHDEALPPLFDMRQSRAASATNQAQSPGGSTNIRGLHMRYLCDKSMSLGRVAGWVATDHGGASIMTLATCIDPQGRSLASTRLTAPTQAYKVLRIHSQRDWDTVCRDPLTGMSSTLGTHWITYPEAPGLPPATWDGHLALKPQMDLATPSPWGATPRARIPLAAFDPTRHPAKDTVANRPVWPKGPRVLASALGRHTNAFRNSLNPAPDEGPRSLLASGYHSLDLISDLMPGGGYRVSPFHNSTMVGNLPTIDDPPPPHHP